VSPHGGEGKLASEKGKKGVVDRSQPVGEMHEKRGVAALMGRGPPGKFA